MQCFRAPRRSGRRGALMTDPVFFAPSRRISVAEIAELTGAKLADQTHGERRGRRHRVGAADGGEGKLVFVEGKRNAALLKSLSAAAVLCTSDVVKSWFRLALPSWSRREPQRAFALIGRLLYPAAARPHAADRRDRHLAARRHFDAKRRLEAGAIVEAGAVIGPGVAIGSRHGRCRQCGDRRIDPDRPRLLCRTGRQRPVRADRQPGCHPSAAPRSARRDSASLPGRARPSGCRRSAASSSRTTSRSAPTPPSIAARWPTR